MPDSPYLRIPVEAVTLGMYVHKLCGSWITHPFWRGCFLIEDPKDLLKLRQSSVKEVLIDPRKGLSSAPPAQPDDARTSQYDVISPGASVTLAAQAPLQLSTSQRRSLEDELQSARQLCIRSKKVVMEMFQDARLGKVIQAEGAHALVSEIAASVERHPSAIISLARLKTADEYTYLHSIAVCALMIALARQIGLEESLVREAGVAGLLHDIGKMSVPIDVLNKPGRLDESEFATVREHPRRGADILREGRQVSALVLDVCLHHHEKLDGTGYPHGLAGDQISLFARMGAICDVYDAVTSDRPYKPGWDPAESLQRMSRWCGGHLDGALFQSFVRCLGIYPVGTLVHLQSERLGVVVEQSSELLLPIVKVFYSTRTKAALPIELIDLSNLKGQERILGRELPEKWGFRNLEALWCNLDSRRGSLFE
ncbi:MULTISPECIES: HD-GYP domain-containing protein [Pseudomonas]|uniref:HD-GYP domain-containing protein n=1 Tax=Pseudomonas TaxID=286 RepID=UPI0006D45C2E|nr:MULTISPECIES: HD-GYP domain-containing protein [Pseudomonas]NNN28669.1 HD-GYP domain-containing protein [Pseudomonas nitroreducens]OBY88705.1 phosphodiesterase [Pseudomonas sp. AU11447]HEP9159971.1 HD-GYP domain-containing protein [Pseudomonas aeruginosa]